jgi:hypothetical protein
VRRVAISKPHTGSRGEFPFLLKKIDSRASCAAVGKVTKQLEGFSKSSGHITKSCIETGAPTNSVEQMPGLGAAIFLEWIYRFKKCIATTGEETE